MENEKQVRLHSSNFGKICKSTTGQVKLAKSFLKNLKNLTLAIKHGLMYEKKTLRKLSTAIRANIDKCGLFY